MREDSENRIIHRKENGHQRALTEKRRMMSQFNPMQS
jgi:hypothetical protein